MRNVARKFTDRSLHSPRQVLALGLLFTLILVAVLPALGQTYKEKVLYSFTSQDGTDPLAGLVRDAAGNLYGTTFYEGPYGNGTVFRIEPSGTFAVLYAFAGGLDGGSPSCNLVQDANGNLYGTMHYKRAPGLEGKSLLVTPPPLCFAAQGFAPLRRRWDIVVLRTQDGY